MVSPFGPTAGRGDDDRGQLMLIAAVAIAVALVGAAVLFNTVLYTASVSPQGANIETNSAVRYEQAVQQDTNRLVNRMANGSEYLNVTQVGYLRSNATNYSRRMSESVAASTAAYVNVSYNDSASTTGARVFDSNPGSQLATNLIGPAEAEDIEKVVELRATVDGNPQFPNSGNPFTIRISEASNPSVWWEIRLYEVNAGPSPDYPEVEVARSGGPTSTVCTMAPSVTEVTLDLTADGDEMKVSPCGARTSFAPDVDKEYDVDIDGGGTNPDGSYELVVLGSPSGSVTSQPAVTTAAFDYVYESTSVTYNTTVFVDVNESVAPERGAVLFYSNYETGSFGPDWTTTGIGSFGVDAQANGSGSQAAYHNGPANGIGYIQMTSSAAVDTSGYDEVVIDFWAQEGLSGNGPELSENELLTLQYLDDSSTWQNVTSIEPDPSTQGVTFDRRYVLDAADDALHGDFRLRFYIPADNPDDYWYVDDVRITGREVDK
jgi:hypothetical protein